MPRYVSHRYRFFLYTTRKCGSQSVKDWKRRCGLDVRGAGRKLYRRFPEYLRAAVVRDPFDRVISAWGRAKCTYKPGTGGRHGVFEGDIWGIERVHLERFLREARKVWDPHWRPQADSLTTRSGELIPDHLIRIEDLEEQWAAFCRLVGMPVIGLRRINSRGGHPNPLKRRKYKHSRDYFTPAARRLAEEIYRRDLELLDYAF